MRILSIRRFGIITARLTSSTASANKTLCSGRQMFWKFQICDVFFNFERRGSHFWGRMFSRPQKWLPSLVWIFVNFKFQISINLQVLNNFKLLFSLGCVLAEMLINPQIGPLGHKLSYQSLFVVYDRKGNPIGPHKFRHIERAKEKVRKFAECFFSIRYQHFSHIETFTTINISKFCFGLQFSHFPWRVLL